MFIGCQTDFGPTLVRPQRFIRVTAPAGSDWAAIKQLSMRMGEAGSPLRTPQSPSSTRRSFLGTSSVDLRLDIDVEAFLSGVISLALGSSATSLRAQLVCCENVYWIDRPRCSETTAATKSVTARTAGVLRRSR
jgi:hypothetical protein